MRAVVRTWIVGGVGGEREVEYILYINGWDTVL